MPAGSSSKMATKNCPKCESANPVACKKCACGHVFFTSRRSAHAVAAADVTDEEQSTPQEPQAPRRRTARVTRERPQFYDALQVENQSRRQRELQKRRKASKSEDTETPVEEPPPEKPVSTPGPSRKRVETPPPKSEPPAKKRRGRPPGLSSRKSTRSQILANKSGDSKHIGDGASGNNVAPENLEGIHDIPPVKALQMNMVLSDINSRIGSSSVRIDETDAPPLAVDTAAKKKAKTEVKLETGTGDKKTNKAVKAESNGTSSEEKMDVDEVPEKSSDVKERIALKVQKDEESVKMEIDESEKLNEEKTDLKKVEIVVEHKKLEKEIPREINETKSSPKKAGDETKISSTASSEEKVATGSGKPDGKAVSKLDEAKPSASNKEASTSDVKVEKKEEKIELSKKEEKKEIAKREEKKELAKKEEKELSKIEEKKELAKKEEKKELPKMEKKKELPKTEEKKELPKTEEKKELPTKEEKKEIPKTEEKKEMPKKEERKEQPKKEEKKELPKTEKEEEKSADTPVADKQLNSSELKTGASNDVKVNPKEGNKKDGTMKTESADQKEKEEKKSEGSSAKKDALDEKVTANNDSSEKAKESSSSPKASEGSSPPTVKV